MVELIITLGLLSLVGAAAGATMLSGFQLYMGNRQAQTNHGNANNALMVIGRDIQAGEDVTVGADWTSGLTISTPCGGTIVYSVNNDNALVRTGAPAGWPVPFVGAHLYGIYSRRAATGDIYVSVLVQPARGAPDGVAGRAARADTGVKTRIATTRVSAPTP